MVSEASHHEKHESQKHNTTIIIIVIVLVLKLRFFLCYTSTGTYILRKHVILRLSMLFTSILS